eukprot:CAMPEP_0197938656 /NCGR_PEP_ID=MMETSP1439-20131203/118494_1 /TAXON_ID=66791 /ORGANISM="Gonyaulax spinifera, Strain CCMP409" /LENGTH=85 /DNA_ID=CAMNT_0043561735 /DNA_START=186 /DNA_END=440 /DNA_ORIENTATION=-
MWMQDWYSQDLRGTLVDVAAKHLDGGQDVVLQYPPVMLRHLVVCSVAAEPAREQAVGDQRHLEANPVLAKVLSGDPQRRLFQHAG